MSPQNLKITDRISNSQLEQAAQIFYDAFELKILHLELFAATRDRAVRILMRSFRPDCAWYALEGDVVLGLLGLERPNGEHFLNVPWTGLQEEFGWLGALWRFGWIRFSQWFQRPRPGDLRIEAVAVVESARGRGVGTQLIEHVTRLAQQEGYRGLVLEVVDTNPMAQKLYERLGFYTVRQDWVRMFTHRAGFSRVTYMRKRIGPKIQVDL
jgi:GNAT superfamily N-acetyltransferase